MEILQTIWKVLTTEDEFMMNILCSPLTFLEIYITMLLFTTILKLETTKLKNFIYVFVASTIANISTFVIPTPYYTFINVLTCPILVMIIYKTNIIKAILAEILPLLIAVCSGTITQILAQNIFGLSAQALDTTPIYRMVFPLLSYFIMYIVYLLLKNYKFYINLLDNMSKKNKSILFINLLIGIIAVLILSILAAKHSDSIPPIIITANIGTLVIYFLFSMFSLIRTTKLEQTTEELEAEQLYNKTITILYDNIRGFKHDFNNMVRAISGYISTNNIDGLKEYNNDLMKDCQKLNNLAILNPELINNPAVYSLLTSKYHKAEELGIKVNLDVFLDLQTLNIKTYDLTRILGILLDNAIEASSKCEEKEIIITIRKDNKINKQLFIIENTYSNKDIDIDRIFEKGYTSKNEKDLQNHGLGLWNVRKIIKKNNNLNLYTTKDSKLFKQQLEIYF